MRQILTILILTLCLTTHGQTCDILEGKLINCIDTAGLRQGYWELNKKKILVSGHGGLGSIEGCSYFEKAEYYPLAKGHYENDRKTGTWEYYSGDHLISLERKITYFDNGSVKDVNQSGEFTIDINRDTTVVTGFFYHELDSIEINCKTKNCTFKLSNGKGLQNFYFSNLDDLEYELQRLKSGVYNREIKNTTR